MCRHRALIGESPLSAEEVRAAAEVHRELGPDYGDAVVESFLARIDQHFEARIDQQLGSKIARPTPADRSCPPEQAAGDPWRGVIGSVLAGTPLSIRSVVLVRRYGGGYPAGRFW